MVLTGLRARLAVLVVWVCRGARREMRLRADGEEAASGHRSARVEGDREWTDRLKYELELAGVAQAGAWWREDWDQVGLSRLELALASWSRSLHSAHS